MVRLWYVRNVLTKSGEGIITPTADYVRFLTVTQTGLPKGLRLSTYL